MYRSTIVKEIIVKEIIVKEIISFPTLSQDVSEFVSSLLYIIQLQLLLVGGSNAIQ